jgi:hypothetical protein
MAALAAREAVVATLWLATEPRAARVEMGLHRAVVALVVQQGLMRPEPVASVVPAEGVHLGLHQLVRLARREPPSTRRPQARLERTAIRAADGA